MCWNFIFNSCEPSQQAYKMCDLVYQRTNHMACFFACSNPMIIAYIGAPITLLTGSDVSCTNQVPDLFLLAHQSYDVFLSLLQSHGYGLYRSTNPVLTGDDTPCTNQVTAWSVDGAPITWLSFMSRCTNHILGFSHRGPIVWLISSRAPGNTSRAGHA